MPDDTPATPLDITLITGAAPANPAGDWVTVSEAVARTGKAERTVRRWVDEGLLDSKRQAGRLLIWMPATGAAPATDVISDRQDVTREITLIERQTELIERLSRQQAELAEQQAAPLRVQIDARDATIREQAEELGKLRAELAAARRPWWRFWR